MRLLLLLQILTRRHAIALSEALAEVAWVSKTRTEGYLGYAEMGSLQKFSSMTQSKFLDEIDGCKASQMLHLLIES